MAFNLEFYLALAITILMFLVGVIFVTQSIRRKRKAYSLTVAVFIGMVASLISVINQSTSGEMPYRSDILLVIHLGTWCIMYLGALLFFAQLSGERINNIIISLGSLFAVLHVAFGILWIFDDKIESDLHKIVTYIWDFNYAALGALVFIYGAYVHFKTYNKTQEKPGIIIGTALSFIALGFIFGFMNDLNVPGELGTVGEVFKIIGILTFVIFYVVQIDYIFRLPFNISSVIVFNRFGMLIYAGKYGEEEEELEVMPIDLITAAVNAFASFMVETTGSKEPLEKVITGDKLLIVKQGELSSVAVICDDSSYFLVKSMENMITKIEEKYTKELEMDYADSSYFGKIPRIIAETFPYLGLPKLEKY